VGLALLVMMMKYQGTELRYWDIGDEVLRFDEVW
jgi:hypothetical protein